MFFIHWHWHFDCFFNLATHTIVRTQTQAQTYRKNNVNEIQRMFVLVQFGFPHFFYRNHVRTIIIKLVFGSGLSFLFVLKASQMTALELLIRYGMVWYGMDIA